MNLRTNLFIFALLATTAVASRAFAADGSRVNLQVPFSFVVSGRTLPPGAYQLSENGSMLYLRGTRTALLIPSTSTAYGTTAKPGLIFRREGGVAYLVGVQMSDQSRSLPFHPEHAALASH